MGLENVNGDFYNWNKGWCITGENALKCLSTLVKMFDLDILGLFSFVNLKKNDKLDNIF